MSGIMASQFELITLHEPTLPISESDQGNRVGGVIIKWYYTSRLSSSSFQGHTQTDRRHLNVIKCLVEVRTLLLRAFNDLNTM
ncbi:hypothetical protein CEXT_324671 [Caerostris extrusa]|uniref:Uncharacterized protein n=1 Tax=Caerostris extrusa TaxID=172846 RepID=A0AAV4R3N6_CAEEX|nr:hypothetical protein CEXT_324671 [Caerostris extrusa]